MGGEAARCSANIDDMRDSGDTIQLDPARFAVSSRALGDRLADLAEQRQEVGAAVDALLGSWRGDASATFRTHWELWRDNADDVIDGLRHDVDALDLASADLGGADRSSGLDSTRLKGRLG